MSDAPQDELRTIKLGTLIVEESNDIFTLREPPGEHNPFDRWVVLDFDEAWRFAEWMMREYGEDDE